MLNQVVIFRLKESKFKYIKKIIENDKINMLKIVKRDMIRKKKNIIFLLLK